MAAKAEYYVDICRLSNTCRGCSNDLCGSHGVLLLGRCQGGGQGGGKG